MDPATGRVLGVAARAKLVFLAIAGVAAMGLGWFAMDRLGGALSRQGADLAALGEPARSLLSKPALASLPGAAAVAVAFAGLALKLQRGRVTAIVLATLCLLAAVGLLVVALLQVLGPLYEYKPL